MRPKLTCPGCRKSRCLFRRGLCVTCYHVPRLRKAARHGNARHAAVPPDRRNAVLSDPALCPPALLFAVARDVARRFGGRVLADDLYQVGWLVLAATVPSWVAGTKEGGAPTLIHFARKGIRSAMYKYALAEVRMETLPCPRKEVP